MKFYLTTPIYYVNDFPHIGHAYTTIAADVIARWHRLNGKDVFFLTGTDEHGAKIVQAAQKQGKSPKDFCDGIVLGFKSAWKDLEITNDGFIRTTDPAHENAVQFFLDKLNKSGYIYKSKYEGLYCIPCEKFMSEEDLDEKGLCPNHKKKPILHSEENYFFKLSAFKDKLLTILTDEKNPNHLAVFPIERRNEITGKLKTGLEDISISRSALEWGISLPFDKKQTVYVWIDALLNYITAIGYSANDKNFKKLWPCDLHLMAKDILWFHSVIWPAMLLAVDLEPPKKLFAHGFFTINGEKMSKTLGNVIRPGELINKFGKDATKYLLLSLFPFGTDGDISWQSLKEKYNVDLANNLGNLVSRTTSMVFKYFQGTIPERKGGTVFSVKEELKATEPLFDELSFNIIIDKIQKSIDRANRYIESCAPWKMAKENNPALADIMYDLLQAIGQISLYLLPIMPNMSKSIWDLLDAKTDVETAAKNFFSNKIQDLTKIICSGNSLKKGDILFPRILE
jgi:methionyl-tRNA synthetase